MRGEHMNGSARLIMYMGSSPHARGTPDIITPIAAFFGIIPACAGNTGSLRPIARNSRDHPRMRGEHRSATIRGGRPGDHPRMRGEHSLVRMARVAVRGSSPHARGTPPSRRLALGYSGIIPACAGNTRYLLLAFLPPRDHPRMRGEHEPGPPWPISWLGSSPHARGTLSGASRDDKVRGIIPACAGNT